MYATFHRKFLHTFKFPIVHSQIFALVAFDCTETDFQESKIRCIYSIAALVLYTSSVCFAAYSFINAAFINVRLIKIVQVLTLVINETYLGTIWICAIVHRKKIINLLNKLITFDMQLQANSMILDYGKHRKRLLNETLIRDAAFLAMFAFMLLGIFPHPSTESTAQSVIFYVLVVIVSATCNQICGIILMLNVRFSVLNGQIMDIVKLSRRNNMNAIKLQAKNTFLKLSKICALHHQLTKAIALFNESYGLVILWLFTVTSLDVVMALFYFITEIQMNLNFTLMLWTITSRFPLIGEAAYVCHLCHSTIQESRKSAKLIHKILTEDPNIIDAVEMFSLQIANGEITFSAAGFFSIDRSLLLSIGSGIIMYTIIVIQLSATPF